MMGPSGASQATLSARQAQSADKAYIEIHITDNGEGFDADGSAGDKGRGISNIKMRAATLGAELSIQSRPGKTRATILLIGALTP